MSTSPVTAAVANLLTIARSTGAPAADERESPQMRALIAAARAGDRDAFGDLVTRHQRVVYRTALAALGAPEDA
jgi:DNA-binding GntR family transcriptional regulator